MEILCCSNFLSSLSSCSPVPHPHVCHHLTLTPHPSPLTPHPSSLTSHSSSLIPHGLAFTSLTVHISLTSYSHLILVISLLTLLLPSPPSGPGEPAQRPVSLPCSVRSSSLCTSTRLGPHCAGTTDEAGSVGGGGEGEGTDEPRGCTHVWTEVGVVGGRGG